MPTVNRVDALIQTLWAEGRTAALESELRRLDPASLSPDEQASWWHAYGIAAFHDGREVEALRRFEIAHEKFPDHALIRFSLGQQRIRTGAVETGFALFHTCRFPEVPREYALAQARYAYLWDRFDDGLAFIQPFFEIYRRLRILDDHFLFIRGLPFFGQAWGYLAAFAILSGRFEPLETETRFAVEHCRDYDFDYLQLCWQAYRDDQPALLLEIWAAACAGAPSGDVCLNAAIIRARIVETLSAAQAIIGAVNLGENDWPILEDVRTLALAEAAHRHGDAVGEREHVTRFIARQPLLLEPDVALNFHLLRYQERLKPVARRASPGLGAF